MLTTNKGMLRVQDNGIWEEPLSIHAGAIMGNSSCAVHRRSGNARAVSCVPPWGRHGTCVLIVWLNARNVGELHELHSSQLARECRDMSRML